MLTNSEAPQFVTVCDVCGRKFSARTSYRSAMKYWDHKRKNHKAVSRKATELLKRK